MRQISLSGYVDDISFWGDEMTPGNVSEALYAEDGNDDVDIILDSPGGSCDAAVKIYDVIRGYPGNVRIVISGMAASAATMIAMAGNSVAMTPGSIFMVHDPSTVVYGNEQELTDAIEVLRVYKDSILNLYAARGVDRNAAADAMVKTTFMDANTALEMGFIDEIADAPEGIRHVSPDFSDLWGVAQDRAALKSACIKSGLTASDVPKVIRDRVTFKGSIPAAIMTPGEIAAEGITPDELAGGNNNSVSYIELMDRLMKL